MIFYKGVKLSDLDVSKYIPGTVATKFSEAHFWKERLEGASKKGASRHIEHGESVVICISFNDNLLPFSEFQRADVSEHDRMNCWTSSSKTKAQINTEVDYRIIDKSEYAKLLIR